MLLKLKVNQIRSSSPNPGFEKKLLFLPPFCRAYRPQIRHERFNEKGRKDNPHGP
jgi:hypothetical protein